MKSKEYQKKIWKNVNLSELNKHLLTHKVSSKEIETEIIMFEKILKKPVKKKKQYY